MHFCFFTENHYKGGLDTFVINLINHWPDKTADLTVVCNASHPGLATIRNSINPSLNIETYRYFGTQRWFVLKEDTWFFTLLRIRLAIVFLRRVLHYPLLLWYVIRLFFFFRTHYYDRLMVVNGGYPGSLICRSAGIAWRIAGKQPLAVHNFHNFTRVASPLRRPIEDLIDSWVEASSRNLVSVSNACLRSLESRKMFRASKKLICIPNGIEDPEQFDSLSSRGSDLVPSDKEYLVMLATYEKRKGHAYLLKAYKTVLERHPNVKLFMYGNGSRSEKLRIQEIIDELGLARQAHISDFITHPGPIIAASKAVLVPSQAFESFGFPIVEAMARQTPVVATDVGGIPEVIDHMVDGILCDPQSATSFAEAILAILDSPVLARRIGNEGRKKFERLYRASRMADSYYALLRTS